MTIANKEVVQLVLTGKLHSLLNETEVHESFREPVTSEYHHFYV